MPFGKLLKENISFEKPFCRSFWIKLRFMNSIKLSFRFTFVFSNTILFLVFKQVACMIHVEHSGILPVKPDSYAIQFYLTVANDASSKVVVASGKPRCCWQVEKNDIDCESMVLIGGNEVIVSPKTTQNISFLFPTTYPRDRIGKCHFVLRVNKHRIQHQILFNTTEPKKELSWKDTLLGFGGQHKTCKGVDLDPRSGCKPVDCLEKYNGKRSFFDKDKGKCQPVRNCYTKMKNDKDLPEIAFDKDHNDCKSLIGDKLTAEQEKFLLNKADKSSLAKKRFSLEDVKEINPIPLNCNHGTRVGSMCVCDEGWGTDTSVVPDGDMRFIFNWCNKRIVGEQTLSQQVQKIAMLSGLGLISISLLIGWIIIIWGFFIAESPSRRKDYLESDSDESRRSSSRSDSSDDRYGFVLRSYTARKDDELTLKKGQRIRNVRETNRNGWMKGNLEGRQGYFPSRNVKVCYQDQDSSSSDSELA